MKAKTEAAAAYVEDVLKHSDNLSEAINDAANFFSDNYIEYLEISHELNNLFRWK